MYSIKSRDRRVTNYVREKAYEWLYAKIANNEYESHSNESENVILSIQQQRKVDAESYKLFSSYFSAGPYYYMLNNDREEALHDITSRSIDNYFIKFNDEYFPLGFIKEFFEDDYETRSDIEEFYHNYLSGEYNDFFIANKKIKNNKELILNKARDEYKTIFNTKFGHHFMNIVVRFFMPLFVLLMAGIPFVSELVRVKSLDKVLNSPSGDIMAINMLLAAWALLYLLIVSFRIVRFYARFLKIRLYVSGVKRAMDAFDAETMDAFMQHYAPISRYLVSSPYIKDEPCFVPPPGKAQYVYIVEFNVEYLKKSLKSIKDKFGFKINVLLSRDKKWGLSILFHIIVAAVVVIINNPDLRKMIVDLIEKMG